MKCDLMIDKLVPGFAEKDRILSLIATSGYVICHDVRGINPSLSLTTYSSDWQMEYQRETYGLSDPTVRWGMFNNACIRWSEIGDDYYVDDTYRLVMSRAAENGLKYGMTYTALSEGENPKKCFCAASRADTEFSDEELSTLTGMFSNIIDTLVRKSTLTSEETDVLELLGLGLSQNEVAMKLGITQQAVRYKLDSARSKLGIDSTTETILVAHRVGMTKNGQNEWR